MSNPPTKKHNWDIVQIRWDYSHMKTRKYRQALMEKCKNNPLIDLWHYLITKEINFKIPKDAWHEPLINKYWCKNNSCWLWESTQLELYLSNYYPECYSYCQSMDYIRERRKYVSKKSKWLPKEEYQA